ncbi:MAG: hypothetical protein BWY68_00279 [bacterium ADurb.Bin400]|nr:MAG: hypothetical protein BWY68_00279 [bacterium ADurb.Bin400]
MSNSVVKHKRPPLVGFYFRKFTFFLVLFFMLGFGYFVVRTNQYYADEYPIAANSSQSTAIIRVEVLPGGQLVVDGKETTQKVKLLDQADEVSIPVLDNSGSSYEFVQILLTLPAGIASQTQHKVLAIHGVGSSKSYVKDERTIVYEANNVSPFAVISVVAEMPKGTIKLDTGRYIQQSLSQIKGNAWLLLTFIMPSITFIFMILIIAYKVRRTRIDVPDKEVPAPPMAIPPALVGVLFHQKVRSREVAATLIDLAIRGDIVILDRERTFAFGKGRFDQRLLGYEKILLSKIFKNNLSADRLEFERRINDHFYSKKISLVSAGIYALATRLGYFKTNPQRIYAKYRFAGMLGIVLGVAGFFLSVSYFTNPPYLVFFWVGMMLSAIELTLLAYRLPIRTIVGQETLSNWLAFKKYLSNPEPLPYSHDLSEMFQRYLPYAIVLDCEAAWAKRFENHNFALPNWFVTEKNGLGIGDFCLALFPIISYVSRSLVALREPGFE